MATLQAHGTELFRFFSPTRRVLVAVMADGVSLYKSPFSSGWKLLARKKPEVSLDVWRERKLERIATLPEWARKCKTLPSHDTLKKWDREGFCKTPTGHKVEPDGVGPDGVPSWLSLLGLI